MLKFADYKIAVDSELYILKLGEKFRVVKLIKVHPDFIAHFVVLMCFPVLFHYTFVVYTSQSCFQVCRLGSSPDGSSLIRNTKRGSRSDDGLRANERSETLGILSLLPSNHHYR